MLSAVLFHFSIYAGAPGPPPVPVVPSALCSEVSVCQRRCVLLPSGGMPYRRRFKGRFPRSGSARYPVRRMRMSRGIRSRTRTARATSLISRGRSLKAQDRMSALVAKFMSNALMSGSMLNLPRPWREQKQQHPSPSTVPLASSEQTVTQQPSPAEPSSNLDGMPPRPSTPELPMEPHGPSALALSRNFHIPSSSGTPGSKLQEPFPC